MTVSQNITGPAIPTIPARPCLALLTDFGLKDPYVGQLKAVVYRQCPEALVVDISHEVPTFNVRVAAYFLAASAPHFPAGTAFLTVVDPGVGSKRDVVVLKTASHTFIAPNNGILSLVAQNVSEASLWRLIQKEEQLNSTTFAGRDIIAPAIGKLLNNINLEEIAEPMALSELYTEHWSHASTVQGWLDAEILHVDHFGNVIINLTCKQKELLKLSGSMLCKFRGEEYPLFSASYYAQSPARTLALIPGSQGYMEIAMNRNSAARFMGLDPESDGGVSGDLRITISY